MGVYEDVKQALQDVVAPEIRSLQAEIKRLEETIRGEIKRLDQKTDSLKAEILTEIRRLDEKIDAQFKSGNVWLPSKPKWPLWDAKTLWHD